MLHNFLPFSSVLQVRAAEAEGTHGKNYAGRKKWSEHMWTVHAAGVVQGGID